MTVTPQMLRALELCPKTDRTGGSIDRCTPADPIILPRLDEWHDPENFAIGPGWSPVYRDDNGTKKYLKPHIRCKCGNWTGIGLHHVHADGRVTASFFDATAAQLAGMPDGKRFGPGGCGWHVFIKLDGYTYGDFPPTK